VEEGGFKYDSDSYADDLPYWTLEHDSKPHLIVPYTLTTNDMRFVSSANYGHGGDFCQLLKDNLK
jgi:allantoinase